MIVGGLSEWLKELVLKTCEGSSPSVGSNPTPSFVEKTKWENGKHCVTLEELLEEIKNVPITKIPVGALKLFGSRVLLEEKRIQEADLTFPIIIIFKRGVLYRIVDGHHRAEKAFRMGLKELPCKKVNWKDLPKKFRKIF